MSRKNKKKKKENFTRITIKEYHQTSSTAIFYHQYNHGFYSKIIEKMISIEGSKNAFALNIFDFISTLELPPSLPPPLYTTHCYRLLKLFLTRPMDNLNRSDTHLSL